MAYTAAGSLHYCLESTCIKGPCALLRAATDRSKKDEEMNVLKTLSATGILGSIAAFFVWPGTDFAGVLLGILSLTIFMLTLLPVRTE